MSKDTLYILAYDFFERSIHKDIAKDKEFLEKELGGRMSEITTLIYIYSMKGSSFLSAKDIKKLHVLHIFSEIMIKNNASENIK